MGGTGAYIHNALLVGPDHGSAGHAQNPHIQGGNVGRVSAYHRVVNGRTAVLDNADVGGGASHLKVHAVGSPQVHKGSHNGGRRAGEHGQHRALLHLGDLHNAAVASHNHQGHIYPRLPDGSLGGVCRVQHLGKNGGVDGRSPCTAGKSVQLGDVGGHGGGDSLGACHLIDLLLRAAVVHAEGHGGHKHLGALGLHPVDGLLHNRLVHFLYI